MPAPQFRYWILTIPHHLFTPYLPPGVSYIKGQIEQGDETGYLHWQLVAYFPKKVTLTRVKSIFSNEIHAEGTKSEDAENYVWKDDTSVGHRFELGKKSIKRNSEKDWDSIWESAKAGKIEEIPKDVAIRCFSQLQKISVLYQEPRFVEKEIFVFWGLTGTGKSHTAWADAGIDAYPKEPTTKWWCGYRGQKHVVIDEFRGQVGISHLLRWFDKYPVCVEAKGTQVVLQAEKIWITSNLSPDQWYPDLDEISRNALKRRFTKVVHYTVLGQ